MNRFQLALRDFQDAADDFSRSSHRNFDNTLRRLVSTVVPGTPLGDVADTLPDVDFRAWYDEQRQSVGSMVGSGTLDWPDDRPTRLALQLEMLRALSSGNLTIDDITHNFIYVRNHYDDNIAEFLQQVFRPFLRDFLRFAHDNEHFEGHLRAVARDEPVNTDEELILFISHSARDESIAKALVKLFEQSLKISARKIRCTSVDGYRLPAGADTNDVLRTEVFGTRVLIALLTPNSLASQYVLFELGARWGARRPLFPVVAGGTAPGDLTPPLNGLNALSASVANQVRQLVEDTAAALSLQMEPIASFSDAVDAVVAASAA